MITRKAGEASCFSCLAFYAGQFPASSYAPQKIPPPAALSPASAPKAKTARRRRKRPKKTSARLANKQAGRRFVLKTENDYSSSKEDKPTATRRISRASAERMFPSPFTSAARVCRASRFSNPTAARKVKRASAELT